MSRIQPLRSRVLMLGAMASRGTFGAEETAEVKALVREIDETRETFCNAVQQLDPLIARHPVIADSRAALETVITAARQPAAQVRPEA